MKKVLDFVVMQRLSNMDDQETWNNIMVGLLGGMTIECSTCSRAESLASGLNRLCLLTFSLDKLRVIAGLRTIAGLRFCCAIPLSLIMVEPNW